jgi:hypothetical protein
MVRKAVLLGLAAVVGSAAAGSVTLTDSNFETEVFASGKNAFIKFQAPWCATTLGSAGGYACDMQNRGRRTCRARPRSVRRAAVMLCNSRGCGVQVRAL